MGKKKDTNTKDLLNNVVNSIQEKKGTNIIIIDFSDVPNAVANYFVICTGNSRPQVEAIVEEVKVNSKKLLNQHPSHIEGLDNSEWVLIDYFDLVVHVFQPESREFYQLEKLWADAPQQKIKEY